MSISSGTASMSTMQMMHVQDKLFADVLRRLLTADDLSVSVGTSGMHVSACDIPLFRAEVDALVAFLTDEELRGLRRPDAPR